MICYKAILESIDLSNAFLFRSLLFDKTPTTNWRVAWHQDTKIPFKEKFEAEGYTAWSAKEEALHVQPPAEILAGMRPLRLPC